MTERICDLLNLSISAGLGRRLAAAEIKQDATESNLFHIRSNDSVVEASTLARALSVLAEEVLHLEGVHFRAVRTSVCH
jgi:hypothetical protein